MVPLPGLLVSACGRRTGAGNKTSFDAIGPGRRPDGAGAGGLPPVAAVFVA